MLSAQLHLATDMSFPDLSLFSDSLKGTKLICAWSFNKGKVAPYTQKEIKPHPKTNKNKKYTSFFTVIDTYEIIRTPLKI